MFCFYTFYIERSMTFLIVEGEPNVIIWFDLVICLSHAQELYGKQTRLILQELNKLRCISDLHLQKLLSAQVQKNYNCETVLR